MVKMYFSLLRDGNLIYEDKKPSKNKTFIQDIRTLDLSKKGLRGVNHDLTIFYPDGRSKDLQCFVISCGHDFYILQKMIKNTLIISK
jgi:hypothetical protein